MYQIIKIVGVPPEAIPRLHEFLKANGVSQEYYWSTEPNPELSACWIKIQFAELLNCKLDKFTETYIVELKVAVWVNVYNANPRSDQHGEGALKIVKVFPPASLLLGIFRSLGDFYPDEEIVADI